MIRLAVVIPAFDAELCIAGAIRSAFECGAHEVIVVDDGSSDRTPEVSERHGARVIRQENQGAAVARRVGIAAVTSEAVMLLDADDALIPSGVEPAVRLISDGARLVLGRTVGRDLDGALRRLASWPEGVNIASLIDRGHAPGPPSAFLWEVGLLREVVSEAWPGLWPRYAEDFEFVIRGSALSTIDVIDQDITLYMWQGGKSSQAPLSSVSSAEEIRLYYADLMGEPTRPRGARELKAMATMRLASESFRPIQRNLLRARATALSPRLALGKVVRRLRTWDCTPNRNGMPRGDSSDLTDEATFASTIRADLKANPHDPWAWILLISFRLAQASLGNRERPRRSAIPVVLGYRVISELILGIELRPKTRVGPGLAVHHRFGTVVNNNAQIGSQVVLRHGVTIGHARVGGGAPVIGDRVEFGAGAMVIGDVTVGDDAVVAAGAVVVDDVSPRTVVAGNPARQIGVVAASGFGAD